LYVVNGHEAKGADKNINAPNDGTAGATRFQLGITLAATMAASFYRQLHRHLVGATSTPARPAARPP
jgi:hypothetical protein